MELKCNNTAYRPVMDAIDLLQRYLEQPLKEGAFFDPAESVPLAGVVPEQWRAAVVDEKGRVERIPYELCVLVALRDAVRRREIWVVGANRWRNPEDELPADFEDNRDVHYAALGQPQDAREFIAALQGKLRTSLDRFERALAEGTTGGVAIVKKHGEPWIRVSPRGKQEEPESLVAVKGEIERRWGTIDLLDILKYAEFDTDFIAEFASVATRENLSKDVLRRRLLLVLFGLGTNMGIKRVAVTGKHGESEATLRRVRHLFVNRANMRAALRKLVNATFAVRDEMWWGTGTACASDSRKFGAWSSTDELMVVVRGRGVSGKGEEEFFEFGFAHRGCVLVGGGHALAHATGDDFEAGAVQGAGNRGELSDDVLAVAAGLDHGDDTGELPLGATEAVENGGAGFLVDLHGRLLRVGLLRSIVPPGVSVTPARGRRPPGQGAVSRGRSGCRAGPCAATRGSTTRHGR